MPIAKHGYGSNIFLIIANCSMKQYEKVLSWTSGFLLSQAKHLWVLTSLLTFISGLSAFQTPRTRPVPGGKASWTRGNTSNEVRKVKCECDFIGKSFQHKTMQSSKTQSKGMISRLDFRYDISVALCPGQLPHQHQHHGEEAPNLLNHRTETASFKCFKTAV